MRQALRVLPPFDWVCALVLSPACWKWAAGDRCQRRCNGFRCLCDANEAARGGATFQCKLEMWESLHMCSLFSPPPPPPITPTEAVPWILSPISFETSVSIILHYFTDMPRRGTVGKGDGRLMHLRNGQIAPAVGSLLRHLTTFRRAAIRYYFCSCRGFIIISWAQIPIIWLSESAHFAMARDYVCQTSRKMCAHRAPVDVRNSVCGCDLLVHLQTHQACIFFFFFLLVPSEAIDHVCLHSPGWASPKHNA